MKTIEVIHFIDFMPYENGRQFNFVSDTRRKALDVTGEMNPFGAEKPWTWNLASY